MREVVRSFQAYTRCCVRPALCFERDTLEELRFLCPEKFVTLRSLDGDVQKKRTKPVAPDTTVIKRRRRSEPREIEPFSCELP